MKNQQALGESGEEDGGSFSRKKLTEPESEWAAALARITGKYRNKGKLCHDCPLSPALHTNVLSRL